MLTTMSANEWETLARILGAVGGSIPIPPLAVAARGVEVGIVALMRDCSAIETARGWLEGQMLLCPYLPTLARYGVPVGPLEWLCGICRRALNALPPGDASPQTQTGTTMANLVPIPRNGLVEPLATYATAFLNAINETDGLQPGVDMRELLKNAAKNEANVIAKALPVAAAGPFYAVAIAKAAPVLKWLGAIVTNSTPGPWKRDRAISILNDPTVVFRPPSGVDRKAPTFPGAGGRPTTPKTSSSFAPFIGAAAGFAVGGPVGAVAGFAIGTAVAKR